MGEFKNGGREYQPTKSPVKVNVHDFPDTELGKAIPYGIYDVAANTGWVSVGADHDTSAFAVETLRRWWHTVGRHRYPDTDRLLICADGGGSNGYRVRAWKIELAKLAAETGLTITVCHLPPGTSKWNKIEHRLFSQITLNWRGRPLTSHQIIVDLIGATSTATGLTVRAELDTGTYPTGIRYTNPDRRPPDHPPRLPRRVELLRRAPAERHADIHLDYFLARPKQVQRVPRGRRDPDQALARTGLGPLAPAQLGRALVVAIGTALAAGGHLRRLGFLSIGNVPDAPIPRWPASSPEPRSVPSRGRPSDHSDVCG